MDQPQAQQGDAPLEATSRSGFVGIVGRPNVGKSTILNFFLGQKIAIVSPRPQTTRKRIVGVLTRDQAQVIFLDSPGLHEAKRPLGRSMVKIAGGIIEEADVILAVIDATRSLTREDAWVFQHLRHAKGSPILVINKVDLAKKPLILPLIKAAQEHATFAEYIPVSALTGEQMPVLLDAIIARLPTGPRWYDAAHVTDQTSQELVGEFIREQVLLATRQEVPQSVAVLIEAMEDRDRVLDIHAIILVERPGQKAIVIGKGGLMLKQIGQAARREIERLLGRHVNLQLWVKVAKDWRGDPRILRELGYEA